MFQRSSAEYIVRDREDYETRRKYIYENPGHWYYKYLNTDEKGVWALLCAFVIQRRNWR